MENKYLIRNKSGGLELLIYDDIGGGFFGGISARDINEEIKAAKSVDSINVRINSNGGSVHDGIAIYNTLVNHKAPVSVDVDGFALSIASIIAMAADPGRLSMAENAMLMIHDPWTLADGTASELRAQADILDKIRGQLLDTYTARAGSKERAAIDRMMTAETWFTASEALDAGLIDIITGENRQAASFKGDLSKYHNAPAYLKKRQNETIINQSDKNERASAAILSMTNRLKARKLASD